MQDFGVKLQPGYQLACRIYRGIQSVIGTVAIQGRHEKILCTKLIFGEQLAVLSPRLCQNCGDKPQDRGYLETYGSLSWNLFV